MALRASEMGLKESEFWRLTYAEYNWMWEGYIRKAERINYTPAREIMAAGYSPHLKKGKVASGRKIWPLSIDFKKPEKTAEEIKAIFEKLHGKGGWYENHNVN